jgi:hypothetical protein
MQLTWIQWAVTITSDCQQPRRPPRVEMRPALGRRGQWGPVEGGAGATWLRGVGGARLGLRRADGGGSPCAPTTATGKAVGAGADGM